MMLKGSVKLPAQLFHMPYPIFLFSISIAVCHKEYNEMDSLHLLRVI